MVYGTLGLTSGEAVIQNAVLSIIASGDAPEALGVTTVGLGGGALGVQGAITLKGYGPSNVGLLVRTCGEVVAVNGDTFIIDDGGGVNPACKLTGADALVDAGDYVAVTGVSSCLQMGSSLNRQLLLRDASDLAVLE